MSERLTPQLQAADTGIELARQANVALNAYNASKTDKLQLEAAARFPGVSISEEAYLAADEQIKSHKTLFDNFMTAAGVFIGPGSLGEAELGPKVPKTAEQLADDSKTEFLNKTGILAELMAEKFDVNPEDFCLVTIEADPNDETSQPATVLIYSADKGLDLAGENPTPRDKMYRTWYSIMNPRATDRFLIDNNGEEYDSRAGMTEETFAALAAQNPNIQEWVWMTGEALPDDETLAWAAGVNRGQVTARDTFNKRGVPEGILFRPAIVID